MPGLLQDIVNAAETALVTTNVELAYVIRQHAVAHILANEDKYLREITHQDNTIFVFKLPGRDEALHAFGSKQEFRAYMQGQAQIGAWGDDTILFALMQELGYNLYVHVNDELEAFTPYDRTVGQPEFHIKNKQAIRMVNRTIKGIPVQVPEARGFHYVRLQHDGQGHFTEQQNVGGGNCMYLAIAQQIVMDKGLNLERNAQDKRRQRRAQSPSRAPAMPLRSRKGRSALRTQQSKAVAQSINTAEWLAYEEADAQHRLRLIADVQAEFADNKPALVQLLQDAQLACKREKLNYSTIITETADHADDLTTADIAKVVATAAWMSESFRHTLNDRMKDSLAPRQEVETLRTRLCTMYDQLSANARKGGTYARMHDHRGRCRDEVRALEKTTRRRSALVQ